MKIVFLLAILCLVTTSNAQELKLLKQIGIENPNSDSGLAQVFEGEVLDDGNLYFKASYRGWYEGIWKTDGTQEGTTKLFDESELGSWSDFYFTGDGIIFEMNGNTERIAFYNISNQSFTDLLSLPDLFLFQIKEYQDGYMMLIRNENDVAELWVTDKTPGGTYKVDDVGAYHSSMKLYCSTSGAVVYNSNSFVNYEPIFYNAQEDEVIEIVDYLAPFDSIDQVNSVFIYDNLLFLNGKYGNIFRYYIFNLDSESFYPIPFLREVVSFIPYESDVLIMTLTQIIRLNLSDYSFQELSEDVYPRTSFYLDDDKLYFIKENDNSEGELWSINLTTQEKQELENLSPGGYLADNFTQFKGELYYKAILGSSAYLFKYDNAQNKGILIDTIAFENGSYIIRNALEVVGDRLITSVYSRNLGHELFYLSESTNSLQNFRAGRNIQPYPNPAQSSINFDELEDQPYTLVIFNYLGQKLVHNKFTSKDINISHLPSNAYHGYIIQGTEAFTFKFIKD